MSGSFFRKFADAGVFFPAANVCNFMQGGNTVATGIAIANLLYSFVFIAAKRPSRAPKARPFFADFPVPLRVTSYCALVVSLLLLIDAAGGVGIALFPGLAALFFGIGNFIQSSLFFEKLRHSQKTLTVLKAVLHPAVWYGLGYTMTGINIGGGLMLWNHPLGNMTAFILTTIGITETLGSLGFMVSRIQLASA